VTRNVAAQGADPDSVLACYRRLIRARADHPSLQDGTLGLVRVDDPTVLAYRRRGSGAEILVVVAFDPSGADITIPAPRGGGHWRPIVGTHRDLPARLSPGGSHRLRPFEALAVAAER
jgi:glycosidase